MKWRLCEHHCKRIYVCGVVCVYGVVGGLEPLPPTTEIPLPKAGRLQAETEPEPDPNPAGSLELGSRRAPMGTWGEVRLAKGTYHTAWVRH